jgi:hypothetical protein
VTEGWEHVHPDGMCTPSVMSTMKPIPVSEFDLTEVVRMPGKHASLFEPSIVADSEGDLNYVNLPLASILVQSTESFTQLKLISLIFSLRWAHLN